MLRKVLTGVPIVLLAGVCSCEPAQKPTPFERVAADGPGHSTFPQPDKAPIAGGPATPLVPCSPGTDLVAREGAFVPESLHQPTVQLEKAPPPISGGTMLTTADGSTVVAADPDRDRLYFVDAAGMQLMHKLELSPGDEPGRLIEDSAGRIHVVLRGGRAIATVTREPESAITRREVCAQPRGIAYDRTLDELHVACAEGKLVSFGAEPEETAPFRSLELSTDLRDVMVRGDQLFVSRFRAAQLLVLNQDGELQETRTPESFGHDEVRSVPNPDGKACDIVTKTVHVEATPNVAWRAIDVPQTGVVMLHQRSRTDEVQVTVGGYGSGDNCGQGIVKSAITAGMDSRNARSGDLPNVTLAVDIAVDPEGQLLAVVAPGNNTSLVPQVQLYTLSQLQVAQYAAASVPANPGFAAAGSVARPMPPGGPCLNSLAALNPQAQATALSFVSPHVLAVQEREPAAISFYDLRSVALRTRVELQEDSRFETGHTIFHTRTGAGLACASCHPEAGDDGHVWTFATIGPRRTQSLRGGILGTEPLHWNGDMADFKMLVNEVFVGRMSGFTPSADQADALAHWLDRQPSWHADAADSDAAARGKALFESEAVGCTKCHSGAQLTNNQTADVGTGAMLQVPSLKGVRFRTPLMHDGCASTLVERFTNAACGGGDSHGKTSQLSEEEIRDLSAYLETL